jgi:serine/threonine protein kinase/tetratricopeptide (TPR) repeat protein
MSTAANDLREIFCEALERQTPEDVTQFLDKVCADDADLRCQVEDLLAAHRKANNFLGGASSAHGTVDHSPIAERPGTVIGPYKLLRQIGEGGFGVVFLAEQERPVKRRVALKVIKPGMDTREVIARFEAERQALAMMDHPNIAKVYDAGATENGRPYFVMELVQGVPITEYSDQCNLTTNERLGLFIQACQAVQHAHQKGVIHRDIKPTNVLVAIQDGQPAPKIIDFGVAKALNQRLTEHTLMTAFAQIVGTPLYMSPEQAELSPLGVDTRSDVYSLGALLYELLTSTTPFDKDRLQAASYDELRRIIREEEPPQPSSRISTLAADLATTVAEHRRTDARRLRQTIHCELDWIVMKCLEKDRNRRYETPNSLARDIERHLHDQPVQACPPSAGYRLKKFIRRNKVGVVAVSAVVVALVAGATLATTGFMQARRQARIAVAEAEKATAISELLQEALQSANPDKARGTDYTVRQLLDEISAEIKDQFQDKPEVEASLHATIGNSYRRLEKLDKAGPHLEAALELRRRHFGSESPEVADSLADYSWYLVEVGAAKRAFAAAQEAMAIHRELGLPDDLAVKVLEASALTIWHKPQAYGEFEQIVEEIRSIASRHPDRYPQLATVSHWLAANTTDLVKGEKLARVAVELHRKLHGDDHPETAYGIDALANILYDQRKLDEAESCYRESLAIFRRNYDDSQTPIVQTLFRLARIAKAKGDQIALDELRAKAVEIAAMDSDDWENWQYRAGLHTQLGQHKLAVAADTRTIELNSSLADSWILRGRSYQAMGEFQLAEADFCKAIEVGSDRWNCWRARGVFYSQQNQLEKAQADVAMAVKLCPSDPTTLNNLCWSLATVVEGQPRFAQTAVELAERGLAAAPDDGSLWNTLGVAQYRAGDWNAAIESLEKSINLQNGGTAYDWFFLAMANQRLDHKGEALMWYDKGAEWLDTHAPYDEELIRYRQEAAELLGVAEPQPGGAQPAEDQSEIADDATAPPPPTTNNSPMTTNN